MYLMIDNYDSFVHNLASYFEELGEEITLVRNDKISMKEIQAMIDERKLDGLLISPGPKSPQDCGMSLEALCRSDSHSWYLPWSPDHRLFLGRTHQKRKKTNARKNHCRNK